MNQGKRFRRLPDYQAFSHFDGIGGTAVQGIDHGVKAAAALAGPQAYGHVVRKHHGTIGQAVRADGGDAYDTGHGPDQRPPGGKGVCRGAGGGGNQNAVRMVAVQQFSVYLRIQVHHLAGLGADQGNFIQGQLARRCRNAVSPHPDHFKHGTFIRQVGTFLKGIRQKRQFLHGTGGHEPQPAQVHSRQGNAVHGRQGRDGQHGTVPSEGHQHAAPSDSPFQSIRRFNDAGAQPVAGKFPAHDAQRFPQSRFFRQRDQADYLGRIHAGDHTAFFRAAQLVNRNREKIVPPCSIP